MKYENGENQLCNISSKEQLSDWLNRSKECTLLLNIECEYIRDATQINYQFTGTLFEDMQWFVCLFTSAVSKHSFDATKHDGIVFSK